MGNACQSKPNDQKSQFSSNPWEFKFGQDDNVMRRQHNDSIKCKERQIEPIIKLCQQRLRESGKLFKDHSFQTKPIVLVSKDQTKINCTFQRPHIFISHKDSKTKKFFQLIDPKNSNISQIEVHNQGLQCFGVFLCFIAEFPELISQIILTEANSYGLHVLQVKINGKKQYLYIDDYIICQNKLPLFSQVIDKKYIWPSILQKSWFKINGNLKNKIHTTMPQQIFNTYLSTPTRTFILSTQYEYNKNLIQNHINQKSKNTRCIITTKAQQNHKIGISGRKQYYLISHFQGQQQKWFYHFRSPCKIHDFRGSNKPENFSSNIDDYENRKNEEYYFILDQQQFIQQVQQFFIIYYEKQTNIVTTKEVSIAQDLEFYVKVNILHNNNRVSICFNQSSQNKEYNPLMYHVILLKNNECISDEDDFQGCFGAKNTYMIKNIYANVSSGALLVRIKKRKSKTNKIAERINHIIVNSNDKVTIEALAEDQKQYKQAFQTFLKHKGQQLLSIKNSKTKNIHQDIRYSSFWLANLAIVYVINTNKQKKNVRLQVHFPQLKNLQCLTHPNIKTQYASLQPFEDNLLIIFEKIDPAQETIFGKFTIQSY